MATKAVKTPRKLERPRPLKVITEGLAKPLSSPPPPGIPTSSEPSPTSLTNRNNTAALMAVDEVIQELENLHVSISNGNLDEKMQATVARICNQLKAKGHHLENAYKEQLDHYFVTLRNTSRDERVDTLSRLRLLEVIELRAMAWRANENLANYYKRKFAELESSEQNCGSVVNAAYVTTPTTPSSPFGNQVPASPTHQSPVTLGPGEVIKTSGKFAKPTKIPGKNYYKDEIVIRNSDSGKVMGIKGRRVHMIEELSETIISFQRVNPGARDRLVQITGPHEDAIIRGKALIEDTIRRNASPVRDPRADAADAPKGPSSEEAPPLQQPFGKKQLVHSYSMSDASVGEYSYTINVGRSTIKVSSTQVDLVRTAKLVLEEYFAGQAELAEKLSHGHPAASFPPEGQPTPRRPLSMAFSDYSTTSSSSFSSSQEAASGHWEFGGHVTSSPSFGSAVKWMCNGGMAGGDPRGDSQHPLAPMRVSSPCSSSSSEEGTFKEASPAPDEEDSNDASDSVHPSARATVVSSVQLQIKGGEIRPVQSSSDEVQDCGEPRKGAFGGSAEPVSGQAAIATKRRFSGPDGARIAYTRDFLLSCSRSPLSRAAPDDMQQIAKKVPCLVRENPRMFDPSSSRPTPDASLSSQDGSSWSSDSLS